MKDVEANGRFSYWQRGLGGTSTTRLTPCEVAQHDAPTGAARALCANVISSRRAECRLSLLFHKIQRMAADQKV